MAKPEIVTPLFSSDLPLMLLTAVHIIARSHTAPSSLNSLPAVRHLLRRLPGLSLPSDIAEALLEEIVAVAAPLVDDAAFLNHLDIIEPQLRAVSSGVAIAMSGYVNGDSVFTTPDAVCDGGPSAFLPQYCVHSAPATQWFASTDA